MSHDERAEGHGCTGYGCPACDESWQIRLAAVEAERDEASAALKRMTLAATVQRERAQIAETERDRGDLKARLAAVEEQYAASERLRMEGVARETKYALACNRERERAERAEARLALSDKMYETALSVLKWNRSEMNDENDEFDALRDALTEWRKGKPC